METRYSPSPWNISKLAAPDYAPQFGIYSGDSQRDLAQVIGDNSAANSALIASAPDLLEALIELHSYARACSAEYRNSLGGTDELYSQVHAAIAKANGE